MGKFENISRGNFYSLGRWISCFLLLLICTYGYAQKKITGRVISLYSGAKLPGVTIGIKGSALGTVSDIKGNFEIYAKTTDSLIFSFVGYKSKTVFVGNRSYIKVQLQPTRQQLGQLVVVGYGTKKKADLTGSVSSISGNELDKAIHNSIDQLVQGRAAGVTATSTTGAPGAPVAIRIRGNNSISGNNSPLYVVDGIPQSGVPRFNPQDIASLEILKDASATAIYGSRGANGVILITTKAGSLGKPKFEFYANTSISTVLHTYEMLNGEDYAKYRNEANRALGNSAPFPNYEQYVGEGFDWQDEIINNGLRNNIGLNISGGDNNVKYFVSGDYLNDQGIVLNSQYRRSNLRANIDINALNDRLKLQLRFSTSQEKNKHAISSSRSFPHGAGPIVNALMAEPIVPSKTYSGMTGENEQFYNPYLEVTAKKDRQFTTRVVANARATYKITDVLSNTFSAGYNYRLNRREIFYPSSVGPGINVNGRATSNSRNNYDYVLGDYLTYQDEFRGIHFVSATAGVEYSEFNNYNHSTNVSNFEVQSLALDNVGIGTSLNNIGSGRAKSALQSAFLRANYTYNDKYLFTATARADGSSRFAANQKWGYFPSAAIAWKVSEERFWERINVISDLKLRVSLGQTGSQSIAPYQSLARYGTLVYPLGNTPTLGYFPQSVENANLKWETTDQLDIGMDLGLFSNKIELTLDYFKKKTINLLQSISIPSQSGFGKALINFGSIENRGIEFSINAHPINTKRFRWNTNFNFTSYKNIVLSLGGEKEYIYGPTIGANLTGVANIYMPGKEFGIFWGLVATGLIQQSDIDAAEASGKPLPAYNNDRQLGHWKFKDLNDDGVINGNDRQQIGNPNPDFTFGWNNNFSYNNFLLNIFIQGSVGNDVLNTVGTIINEGFRNNESYKNQTVKWYENRWTLANPTNDIRFPAINSISPPAANFMVEDASYIRLKSISLRYRVPIKKSAISRLVLYLTTTNVLTITSYTGFDPEVSMLGPNTLAPGVDMGAYPRQSAMTFGFNLNF